MNPSEAQQTWLKVHISLQSLLNCLGENAVFETETLAGRAKAVASPSKKLLYKPTFGTRLFFVNERRKLSQTLAATAAMKAATGLAMRAISNNEYLLAYHNISIASQLETLNSDGILLSLKSLQAFKSGKMKHLSTIFLAGLSAYWGEPLDRFLTQDFAAEKLKPIRLTPPKTLRVSGVNNAQSLRVIYRLSDPL